MADQKTGSMRHKGMDFTLKTYQSLLEAMTSQGYRFQTFAGYLEAPASRVIILRHDVEARYGNALDFARIQHERGIRGTYYFRILPNHFDKEIIREIASMGHEIGYHYDDLSHCHGDHHAAIKRFESNLATIREIADVKTICMEGAPLSKWDNRELWEQSAVSGQQSAVKTRNLEPDIRNTEYGIWNYRDYGIIGEPYFDLDFSKVLYLTDTGRRWDGKASVRDKVQSSKFKVQSESSQFPVGSQQPHPLTPSPNWRGGIGGRGVKGVRLKTTNDIISAANAGLLPNLIMITFHPQRWTDKLLPWMKELVMQNVKNMAKRLVVRFKG